mgnify:CR=1 FL=1
MLILLICCMTALVHKDEIFTVEYDKTKKEKKANDMKTMVCLKEDTTDPKWLFHASCLTEVATGRVKLNDGKEVKFDIADSSTDEKINKAVQEALDRENVSASMNRGIFLTKTLCVKRSCFFTKAK